MTTERERSWDAAVDLCIELVRTAGSLGEARQLLQELAERPPPPAPPGCSCPDCHKD